MKYIVGGDWFTGLGHLPWISLAALSHKIFGRMPTVLHISLRLLASSSSPQEWPWPAPWPTDKRWPVAKRLCYSSSGARTLHGLRDFCRNIEFLHQIQFWKSVSRFLKDPILWYFLWPHHATHSGYPHRSPCPARISTLDVTQGHFGLVLLWIRCQWYEWGSSREQDFKSCKEYLMSFGSWSAVKGLLQQLFKSGFVLLKGRSHRIASGKLQANVPNLSQLLLERSAWDRL